MTETHAREWSRGAGLSGGGKIFQLTVGSVHQDDTVTDSPTNEVDKRKGLWWQEPSLNERRAVLTTYLGEDGCDRIHGSD